MKKVMYGIKIADVNDFGGWVGYEQIDEKRASVLNGNMYLFFPNEYHIRQFAEGRKFIINVKDDDFGKKIDRANIVKAIVETGTTLSMNGYIVASPAYARNVVKPLTRKTHFIKEDELYDYAQKSYANNKTDFNFITKLMQKTSIEDVLKLIGCISFENTNLSYHYPHSFIIGDNQIEVLDGDYKIME